MYAIAAFCGARGFRPGLSDGAPIRIHKVHFILFTNPASFLFADLAGFDCFDLHPVLLGRILQAIDGCSRAEELGAGQSGA
jgi:hypothetical protein